MLSSLFGIHFGMAKVLHRVKLPSQAAEDLVHGRDEERHCEAQSVFVCLFAQAQMNEGRCEHGIP
jgi:hypothetical protein